MDPIARLFASPARVKILRLFLFNRNETFTLEEVIARTKVTQEDGRKELRILCEVKVIRKAGAGSRAPYRADLKFEYFEALEAFIRATTTIKPAEIVTLLKKAGTLRIVILSGFFTATSEAAIDLLVVGDHLDERSLSRTIGHIEAELGREVRYAAFTTEDFRYRMGVYDRLLRDILDYRHRVLVDKIGLP